MTVNELFSYSIEYLRIGFIVATFVTLFDLGYRRIGKKQISFANSVVKFIFITYLMVLLSATLGRSVIERVVNPIPFSSYRIAWNGFSMVEIRNLIINIQYLGGGYELTDFTTLMKEGVSNKKEIELSDREIRDVLKKYKVGIPDSAKFMECGDGTYQYRANCQEENAPWYSGTCIVNMVSKQLLSGHRNCIYQYTERFPVKIISQEEAFEQIGRGEFSLDKEYQKVKSINIEGVNRGYELDSKGYAQPVYEFQVQYDGNKEGIIKIAAIK